MWQFLEPLRGIWARKKKSYNAPPTHSALLQEPRRAKEIERGGDRDEGERGNRRSSENKVKKWKHEEREGKLENEEKSEKDWWESGRRRGEKERGIEWRKARKRAKVWEDWGVGGTGDYRLSGVFYLWSKCTLAFLLSSPQMQLDSSLAKQTQMKWLLNDFLGNPPRQRKPSIWSLLLPSLPSSSFSFPLSPHSSSPYFSLWFSVIFPVLFISTVTYFPV